MSEIKTVEDAVERLNKRLAELVYPFPPKKPKQQPGQSHKAFGEQMDQWELDRKAHDEAMKAYRAEQGQINGDFANDVLAALGLADHPKGQTLYRMAYERGHSSGYQEVALIAEELAELLK